MVGITQLSAFRVISEQGICDAQSNPGGAPAGGISDGQRQGGQALTYMLLTDHPPSSVAYGAKMLAVFFPSRRGRLLARLLSFGFLQMEIGKQKIHRNK